MKVTQNCAKATQNCAKVTQIPAKSTQISINAKQKVQKGPRIRTGAIQNEAKHKYKALYCCSRCGTGLLQCYDSRAK